jgi:phosphoribosylaminoimidazole-succinocarboxamide synthase
MILEPILKPNSRVGNVVIGDQPIIVGKTKELWPIVGDSDHGVEFSTNRITAGDGARSDVIEGKGAVSNITTCAVFKYLRKKGIPTAFIRQLTDTAFVAVICEMLPLEVVLRYDAPSGASVLKREPNLKPGHVFDPLLFELFLKTSKNRWKEHQLPCDDPYMIIDYEQNAARLHHPKQQLEVGKPFLVIPLGEIFDPSLHVESLIRDIERISRKTFLLHAEALAKQGFHLHDCKYEYGLSKRKEVLLADVIDAESIRVSRDGIPFDKQPYRDGVPAANMLEKFEVIADASLKFQES